MDNLAEFLLQFWSWTVISPNERGIYTLIDLSRLAQWEGSWKNSLSWRKKKAIDEINEQEGDGKLS